MTVHEAVAALYRAITEQPEDERVFEAIQEMVEDWSHVPEYFSDMLYALANGELRDSAVIPKADSGWEWQLRDLLPVLPEVEYVDDDIGRDLLVCRTLHRAAVITYRGEATYKVISWPEPVSAPEPAIQVMHWVDPSLEQVRQWAYAPKMLLIDQDEHLLLTNLVYLPLLVELADDPACPKRQYLLNIVDAEVTHAQRAGYPREFLAEACQWAAAGKSDEVISWSRRVHDLVAYLAGSGPVTRDEARRLAEIVLLMHQRRRFALLEEAETERWWSLRQLWNDQGPAPRVREYLYVSKASGALAWSRVPMTDEEMASHELESREKVLWNRTGERARDLEQAVRTLRPTAVGGHEYFHLLATWKELAPARFQTFVDELRTDAQRLRKFLDDASSAFEVPVLVPGESPSEAQLRSVAPTFRLRLSQDSFFKAMTLSELASWVDDAAGDAGDQQTLRDSWESFQTTMRILATFLESARS